MAQNSLKLDFFKKCICTLAAMWVNGEFEFSENAKHLLADDNLFEGDN